MPPASRNHLEPTGWDAPTSTAAPSLDRPAAINAQNLRRSSRRATPGRPGERITALPIRSVSRFRLATTTSLIEVLRRPVEFARHQPKRLGGDAIITDVVTFAGLLRRS
jgi:hypothetical protein